MVGLVWVRGGQKVGGGSRSDVAHDDVTEISVSGEEAQREATDPLIMFSI